MCYRPDSDLCIAERMTNFNCVHYPNGSALITEFQQSSQCMSLALAAKGAIVKLLPCTS